MEETTILCTASDEFHRSIDIEVPQPIRLEDAKRERWEQDEQGRWFCCGECREAFSAAE